MRFQGRDAARGRRMRKDLGRTAGAGVALALVLFLMPALLVRQGDFSQELLPQGTLPLHRTPSSVSTASQDRGRVVRLSRSDGTVEELTMEEYLWGVVAAEMPASFEEEALKAQACAARTYTVTLQEASSPRHPDAQICDDSGCCQAYLDRAEAEARWGANAELYSGKIQRAVEETDGLGVLYNGAPIQAVFFSSAAGRTVGAVEAWGNSVDYLVGVESPEGEEVPNYHSQVVLTAEEVRTAALAQYPGADLSGDPSGWFSQTVENSAGGVASVDLGGVTLTGSEVRTLFGLRSASFSVSWDGEAFTFDVTGYGHGVGMSQYGANAMAREGSDFEEILTWYYTGTEVGELYGAAGE